MPKVARSKKNLLQGRVDQVQAKKVACFKKTFLQHTWQSAITLRKGPPLIQRRLSAPRSPSPRPMPAATTPARAQPGSSLCLPPALPPPLRTAPASRGPPGVCGGFTWFPSCGLKALIRRFAGNWGGPLGRKLKIWGVIVRL